MDVSTLQIRKQILEGVFGAQRAERYRKVVERWRGKKSCDVFWRGMSLCSRASRPSPDSVLWQPVVQLCTASLILDQRVRPHAGVGWRSGQVCEDTLKGQVKASREECVFQFLVVE